MQETRYEKMIQKIMAAPFALPAISSGDGCRVRDTEGVEYLDFAAGPGVVALGHCHPEIADAVTHQIRELTQGPGKFLTEKTLDFIDRLSGVLPPNLDNYFFTNSGAESVDGAIKLALKYAVRSGKGGTGIIVMDYGFHGRTSLPLSLTTMPDRRQGFGQYAMFPGVVAVRAPYLYRTPGAESLCEELSLESLRSALEVRAPGEISILIAEPILATGGAIVPPATYWGRVVELCREHDVILIFDEVFTGFGRTGKMFASEHWGVVPSIMTLGKAIGGGFPLGAFVASDEVAGAFEAGDHYTTFGANNVVAFAAGAATLEILQREGIAQQAAERGDYLLRELNLLKDKHDIVGDVRGKGLLLGIELVKDGAAKTPDEELTSAVAGSLQERGVLVLISGYGHSTIRLTPPLVVSREEIDDFLEALDAALTEVEEGLQP